MSLRREVLNRIIALLQRKTLIETKNRTLKMHKTAPFDCAINEECCSVDGGRGHLPSFFVPTPGDLTAQESPTRGICCPRQKKKKLMHGGQPGAGLGAAGIDWCINGKRTSIRYVRTGKTGLAFWNFRLSREFSSGMNQKNVYHVFTSLKEFPGICGKW